MKMIVDDENKALNHLVRFTFSCDFGYTEETNRNSLMQKLENIIHVTLVLYIEYVTDLFSTWFYLRIVSSKMRFLLVIKSIKYLKIFNVLINSRTKININ